MTRRTNAWRSWRRRSIARLEYENSKLKSDSADYENRLAAVSGPARFAREFPTVNRILQSAVDKTVSLKAEKPLQNSAKAERGEESAGSAKGKKKSNAKGTRNSKKAKK